MTQPKQPQREGSRLIFWSWITKKDGKRIYAQWFGKRAFPIWVSDGE